MTLEQTGLVVDHEQVLAAVEAVEQLLSQLHHLVEQFGLIFI